MRVAISTTETDPARLLDRVRNAPQMTGAALADAVSTRAAYTVPATGSGGSGSSPSTSGSSR